MAKAPIGVSTPKKAPQLKPAWQPGQSGNPKGRPKGSRNKLGEDFIAAIAKDFEEHGETVIATVRDEDPTQYLKVIASVIPKEIVHTVEDYDKLSDEELEQRFLDAAAGIAGLRKDRGRARAPAESTQVLN